MMPTNANMTTDQLNRYADLTAAISAQQQPSTKDGVPAEWAAKVIAKAANRIEPTDPLHHRIRSGTPMVDPRGLRPIPRPHAAASPSAPLRHELATASNSHRRRVSFRRDSWMTCGSLSVLDIGYDRRLSYLQRCGAGLEIPEFELGGHTLRRRS